MNRTIKGWGGGGGFSYKFEKKKAHWFPEYPQLNFGGCNRLMKPPAIVTHLGKAPTSSSAIMLSQMENNFGNGLSPWRLKLIRRKAWKDYKNAIHPYCCSKKFGMEVSKWMESKPGCN